MKTIRRTFLCVILLTYISAYPFAQNFNWVKTMISQPGSGTEGKSLTVDNQKNIITVGSFTGTVDFDPGTGVSNLVQAPTSNNLTDMFIQKLDSAGNLSWVKHIRNSANSYYSVSIAAASNGDLVITGTFRGSVDFDPGPGVVQLNAQGQDRDDIFIVKLNSNGDFLWARQLSGLYDESVEDVAIAPSGNIYMTGYFNSSIDFDPDPINTYIIDPFQTTYSFTLKFDIDGHFVWVKTNGDFDQGNAAVGKVIALDTNENVYSAGNFNGACDFDPGPDTSLLSTFGTSIFIQKLNKDGQFFWATMLGGSMFNYPYDIATDLQGNVYTTGSVMATFDLDPGPNVLNVTSVGQADYYLQKLDPSGNLLWARSTGSSQGDRGENMAINKFGEVYVSGSFSNLADFDPGVGTNMLQGNVIQKLDSSGNILWAKNSKFYVNTMFVDQSDDLLLSGGFSGTVDFDIGPGTVNHTGVGNPNAYILKMSTSSTWDFHGIVFRDVNGNQLQDSGEPGLSGVMVEDLQQSRFVLTDSSGEYHFYSDMRYDTIRIAGIKSYWSAFPSFAIADEFQSPLNFAINLPSNAKDVSISAVELTSFRPGFQTEVIIQVKNDGFVDADSVVVEFEIPLHPLPELLAYVSAVPAPLTQAVDSLTWLISDLAAGQRSEIRLRFFTPTTAVIGTPLHLSANARTNGDIYPWDNLFKISTIVTGAYDPNDKHVTPTLVAPADIDSTDLRYIIRFQNTGNFPADFVVIRDTMPAELDLSTFKVLSASHPYTWRFYGDRILEFRFDPINLPDSTANEPESHGFVAFTVRAKNGLSLGTSVNNRAGIYFDFNLPVITNTAVLSVMNPVVNVHSAHNEAPLDFVLTPNPAAAFSTVGVDLPVNLSAKTTITLSDEQGKIVRSITVGKDERRVNLNHLPAGTYFVRVQSGKRAGVKLMILK